ncbi:hypothetical protein C1646_767894 [Rhizophagus diaphanus]|nr:hypothetical protein C1646_767894 [Rhizophagus diaphanus] [Rhizophagus sp. MUCL 43196]
MTQKSIYCKCFEDLCMGITEHLTSHKDKCYKSASYTIVDYDDNDQIDVKLKVGDVVDVLEDFSTMDTSQETTTRVKEIIKYHFFFLDWLVAQDTIDRKLKYPIYKLQYPSNYT